MTTDPFPKRGKRAREAWNRRREWADKCRVMRIGTSGEDRLLAALAYRDWERDKGLPS